MNATELRNSNFATIPGRARGWFARTIARKLLAAFFLIFILTYVTTALVVFSGVRSALTHSELGTLSQLAHLTLNKLDAHFSHLATDLRAWSKLDVMNDLASGDVDKRVERALENLKQEYNLNGQLYAFDATGSLVAASTRKPAHGSLPPAWRGGTGVGFVDKHPNPMGSGPIVALVAPITSTFSAGYKLGTLVLVYPWSQVRSALSPQTVLLGPAPGREVLASTVNDHPAEVVHSASRTTEGWVQMDDEQYLAGSARLGSGLIGGWQVVVFREPVAVDHTLQSVALKLAALCAVLALPLSFGIRWLARRLTAPLRDLTQFVAAITDTGDLSQRVALRSRDELGTLANAFNHMTTRLEGAAKERDLFVRELELFAEQLEQKVRERTQELTIANGELTRTLEDLQAAQGQLIQQEKMASLGQLVAGVAHELNNPIGFIYANFPYLQEYTTTLFELLERIESLPLSDAQRAELTGLMEDADLDYLREDLLKIIRSGQSGASRVKEIISSLRSFSRLDEATVKYARLEDGLDDTLALLAHHLRNRIDVVRDYRCNRQLLCHPGQLNQVFMNILYNGIQAMEDTGTLTVSTHIEDAWAVVALSDSGSGIPPELLARIFDPFFTTKKVGEGTGLGLSISYGIVEKHGGRIEVDSTPGEGTTFRIYLPQEPALAGPAGEERK